MQSRRAEPMLREVWELMALVVYGGLFSMFSI